MVVRDVLFTLFICVDAGRSLGCRWPAVECGWAQSCWPVAREVNPRAFQGCRLCLTSILPPVFTWLRKCFSGQKLYNWTPVKEKDCKLHNCCIDGVILKWRDLANRRIPMGRVASDYFYRELKYFQHVPTARLQKLAGCVCWIRHQSVPRRTGRNLPLNSTPTVDVQRLGVRGDSLCVSSRSNWIDKLKT